MERIIGAVVFATAMTLAAFYFTDRPVFDQLVALIKLALQWVAIHI